MVDCRFQLILGLCLSHTYVMSQPFLQPWPFAKLRCEQPTYTCIMGLIHCSSQSTLKRRLIEAPWDSSHPPPSKIANYSNIMKKKNQEISQKPSKVKVKINVLLGVYRQTLSIPRSFSLGGNRIRKRPKSHLENFGCVLVRIKYACMCIIIIITIHEFYKFLCVDPTSYEEKGPGRILGPPLRNFYALIRLLSGNSHMISLLQES